MTKVVCIKKADLNAKGYEDFSDWKSRDKKHTYIGRNMNFYVPGTIGSKWQNPFTVKKYGLEKSLELYRKWIITGVNPISGMIRKEGPLINDIGEIKGSILGCWCKPNACHGDILAELADNQSDISKSISKSKEGETQNLNSFPFTLESDITYPNTTIPLIQLPKEELDILAVNPQGQKVCGANKKRVILFSDYVIKGPYKSNRTSDMRVLGLNIKNNRGVEILENYLSLRDSDSSYLPWKAIIASKINEDEIYYYLVQANVGMEKFKAVRTETLKDSKFDKGRLIACPRSHIDTIQTLMDPKYGGNPNNLTPGIAESSLQYLYLRYILGIGDVNLRNILVRKDVNSSQLKLVAGVDMEERPGKTPTGTRIQLLLPKRPQKPILLKLLPHLSRVKHFKQPLGKELVQELVSIGFTKGDVDKINERIENYDNATS